MTVVLHVFYISLNFLDVVYLLLSVALCRAPVGDFSHLCVLYISMTGAAQWRGSAVVQCSSSYRITINRKYSTCRSVIFFTKL